MSLNNLGTSYSQAGRYAEAVVPAERSVSIRERLAQSDPARYEPELARSYGSQGSIYLASGKKQEAIVSFTRGLKTLTPYFLSWPPIFGGLIMVLSRDYLEACRAAGREPDPDLLGPIVKKIKELSEKEDG